MDIGFGIFGHVKINHVADARNINATGRHISGNQHVDRALAECSDRTVTLNATAYYYVFDDLQVQNFDAVAIQFQTLNAGEVTSQGVDLEFGWRTPVEGLDLSANLSYLDAEFTDTFLTGIGADLDFGDYLDYLVTDHKTKAILLYIEGISDARRFMSSLRAALGEDAA